MAKMKKTAKKSPAKVSVGFKPLGDNVLVRPDDTNGEKKLASGIIIPEDVDKDQPLTGVVIAIGPGRRGDDGALDVAPGDLIVFKKPWEKPIKLDGEEYYVLAESDIKLIKQ